jgi:hypothetical protein
MGSQLDGRGAVTGAESRECNLKSVAENLDIGERHEEMETSSARGGCGF